ncbi:hypothetical protein HYV81_01135 [Candidatus Woesearchaeota archaeon]|nr:hypothetical protein [Candidatus Woesearchaeota archaeon]
MSLTAILPTKTDLSRVVSTGIVPDEPTIRFGGMRVNVNKVPGVFYALSARLEDEGKPDLARAYVGLVNVVEATFHGLPVPSRELPSPDFVRRIVEEFPAHQGSVVTTVLNRSYVEAAAALMFGQYSG